MFPPEEFRTIIDLGGIVSHWSDEGWKVTVLNLMPQESDRCRVIVGDGRSTGFADCSFDLAYSNSAIEHVGSWSAQQAFANELQRIGKAVYCQTPNRWFPVEVHYIALLVHWYPKLLRNYFVARYLTAWGWLARPDRAKVQEYADGVNLLTCGELRQLFPGCEIQKEKCFGVTKSIIAVRGAHTTGFHVH